MSRKQGGTRTPSTRSCYQKALELLARRAHFQRELEAKLRLRKYPAEEIDATLARLAEGGYVDDAATARLWLESRLVSGPWGRRRLRAELARRGADSEVASAALDELVPEDDPEGVALVVDRWLARGGTDPRSLARHLDRRGFSKPQIYDALDDLEIPGAQET